MELSWFQHCPQLDHLSGIREVSAAVFGLQDREIRAPVVFRCWTTGSQDFLSNNQEGWQIKQEILRLIVKMQLGITMEML
jgi:hypothetical protein